MLPVRGLSLLVLAVLCASCAPLANVRPRTLAQDERDVLLATIEHLANVEEYDSTGEVRSVRRSPVVAESITQPVEPYVIPDGETLRDQEIRFPAEAFVDLVQRARSPRPLAALIGDVPGVLLISPARIDVIQSVQGGINAPMETFRKLYPGATEIQSISRPGFDEPRRHAAVQTGFWCGSLCGAVGIVLLEHRDGRWRVMDRVNTVAF